MAFTFQTGDTFRPYGMPEVHRAIRACPQLSDRAKLVWAALVDHQGAAGDCYPGNARIGADIGGVPERRVRGYIAELETAGLIRRKPRRNETGRNSSNVIEFLWRPLEELSPDGGVLPDAGVRGRGTLVSGGRGTLVSSRTKSYRTKPIERTPNPSEEDARVRAKKPSRGDVDDTPRPVENDRRTKQLERTHIEHTLARGVENDTPPVRKDTSEKAPIDGFPASMGSIWTAAGWSGPEEFETWWADLVRHHPNKSKNAVAKTKAIELIGTGQLPREEFEAGYEALAEANRERWAEEGGRFAQNLLAVLDDSLWKFTPAQWAVPPKLAVEEWRPPWEEENA